MVKRKVKKKTTRQIKEARLKNLRKARRVLKAKRGKPTTRKKR